MHLLKKVILFSLSILLINCSNQDSVDKQTQPSPEEYLFLLLDEWPNDLEAQLDSISSVLIQNESDFQLLNFGNSYEENSILLIGEEKSSIQVASDYFSSKSIATTHYDEYYIWSIRTQRGEVKSISQYPHPTLNWVIEIKR